jgi:broad specificity phosphatase PhoE/GNAT superfamily N-acetyltransferase
MSRGEMGVEVGAVSLVYETHSTTTDNEAGRCTGWQPGQLSAAGVENACELGRRRRDDGIDLVVSSDLQRAVQTVDVAFAGSTVPRRTDPRLRECDFGERTGAPVEVMHAQRRARVDSPFPGGQSYRQVADGVADLLAELRRDHDGERVLLVGHAATRYALDHLLTGRPLEAAASAPFGWREGWEYVLGPVLPQLAVLDGPAALATQDVLTAVYRAAFTAASYYESEEAVTRFRSEQLPAHTARPGFRCITLMLAGTVAGFAYGYSGERGQWWTDTVAARVPAVLADEWLGGHFELVEVAVAPEHQGRGFGAALVDGLLLGLPHGRALLTTYDDDRPAPRLYCRLGWELLARGALDHRDLWGLRLPA